jgi:hypothetical protein
MSGGISRTHGGIKPGNLAGVGLQDFTVGFWAGDNTAVLADWTAASGAAPTTSTVAGGGFDQMFRTAIETVGTVSRIGTLQGSGPYTIQFALEALGVDQYSSGYLGMGPNDNSPISTAYAISATLVTLGTTASIHFSSCTVVASTY